jgi:alpha-L-rhamnosidase
MAEIAEAGGRPDDAAGYRALWAKIRSAFADAFVGSDGHIASRTQTAYVLGLHMNLVSEEVRRGQAAEVRDATGNPPASLASFPGAPDAQEAVFRVGSGVHEFSGPALTDSGYFR